jgi:hypothetical protein
MEQTPPAHDADIQERIAGFNAALKPLLGKYELGLTAKVDVLPDGRLTGIPLLISMRKPPEVEKLADGDTPDTDKKSDGPLKEE